MTGEDQASRTELDSHAKTSVVGNNALILHDYDRPITVKGHDPKGLETNELRTASAAVAYDDPETGESQMIVINQAVHIPHLQHNLLSTFQMRVNDAKTNDEPKSIADNPTDDTHALATPDGDGGHCKTPLRIHRTNSYFPFRKPSLDEHLLPENLRELTYKEPEHDPSDVTYAETEDSMLDHNGKLLHKGTGDKRLRLSSLSRSFAVAESVVHVASNAVLREASPTYDDAELLCQLKANVQVASTEAGERRHQIDAETISKNFDIPLPKAQATYKVTAQRGMRSKLHPLLDRRHRTSDRQLRCRRLPVDMHTDTMHSKVTSQRGNAAAQIYAANNAWTRACPVKKESDMHETVDLPHQQEGAANAMTMDNTRAQVGGAFRRKLTKAGVRIKPVQPHSPWMNAVEGTIRETKKLSARDMLRTRSPKPL